MTRRRRNQHSTAQRTFSLDDYRANPAQFIAEISIDPETRKPFELLPAERAFLDRAFLTDAGGRLIYPGASFQRAEEERQDRIRCAPHAYDVPNLRRPICRRLLRRERSEQAQGRVFQAIKRIVESSPELRAIAEDIQRQD